MLRGLSTVSFYADDVQAAVAWYRDLLEVEPYFVRSADGTDKGTPVYAEFRIGDYQHELGIMDARYAPRDKADRPGGAIAYWHVDEPREIYDRLVSMGATPYEPPVERGPGFITASVTDPFGNVLGVMYNQHYLDVLGRH